jgi:hypothetical protein
MKIGPGPAAALLLTAALAALALGASASRPAQKGWLDRFPVDKKGFVPTGSNAFFRLEPGYRLKLEGHEGLRHVTLVVTVLEETRLVDGVETRVVEERETRGGELAEVSRNFFAFHTADRGVYYFGEEVDVYRSGRVAGHEGAWESGRNGARFGLMIPGRPEIGSRFYEEVAPGVAMDRGEIVALDVALKTPAGAFKGCLKIAETSSLEKGREFKIYAPGVGLVQDGSLVLVEYGPKEGR